MDKAKAAVSSFLSKDGKHDTTVHEKVNPAMHAEHVTPTQHENATTVIDREVHQDHHHTTVQPINHQEVLPEKHSHNVAGVEHKNIKHGDDSHVRQKIEQEAAQFKNTREVGQTEHTTNVNPVVAGEHVHHHVHETIQPVIHKETIQPHIVHTTVPIHEVHQNEAKHHTSSTLPAMSMDEFKNSHGSLTGRDERTDRFDGEPKVVGSALGGSGGRSGGEVGLGEKNVGQGHGVGSATGHHIGNSNEHVGHGHQGANGFGSGNGYENGSSTGTAVKKPSLMDKINPKVDSNGDGKPGFMK
jgi:hypothetical protein